jgi:hypothetical protein
LLFAIGPTWSSEANANAPAVGTRSRLGGGAPDLVHLRVGFAIPTTGNIGSALPGGRLGQGAAALAMIFKLAEVPRKTASPNAKIG